MEIIKETDAQLVFRLRSSKESILLYYGILIVVNIFGVVLLVIIYGTAAILQYLFFMGAFDLIFLTDTWKTYTVNIDKSKDTMEISKNTKVIYTSDYSLREIQCIKTVIKIHCWDINSSLVVIRRNGDEEIIDIVREGPDRHLPFYIDIHANTQAKIGNKMAEFLRVPYQDSEYTSSST